MIMGFKALFEREDVYNIISDTLVNFYTKTNTSNDEIYIGFKKKKKSVKYLIFPTFGMIMMPFPNKVIREHYYSSYRIRNSFLKRAVAHTIIFILTHSPAFFFKNKLFVLPTYLVNKSTIFAYSNRTIRIFDYKNNITYSIQKSGFSTHFFDNQLAFRLKNKYDFIPPIIDHGPFWYSEQILEGNMLARETSRIVFDRTVEMVVEMMQKVGNDNKKREDLINYSSMLSHKIDIMLNEARIKKNIETYDKAKSIIQRALFQLLDKDKYFFSVISHGDLQAGNVWVGKNKTYIIDWETVDRRCEWFDEITIRYSTRYFGGISKLVEDCSFDQNIITIIKKYDSNMSASEMIALFVLEDIVFYLEDMMYLSGYSGKESFDRYIHELSYVDFDRLWIKNE